MSFETRQIVSQIAAACALSCMLTANMALASDSAFYQWTSEGHLDEVNRNGVTKKFGAYDGDGNPSSVTEAQLTPVERTTNLTWDPTFKNKLAGSNAPSVAAGQNQSLSIIRNSAGQPTSLTLDGYNPDGTSVSRGYSLQYNGPHKNLTLIDGPLPGTADAVTLDYYPNDPVHGHNRARLQRVTSPTGIVLRDNIQYDALGSIISESRPNGITVTYEYLPSTERVWKETVSDGTKSITTAYKYLDTGEVTEITRNFGTAAAHSLILHYDDALQLTKVADSDGHYVEFTRDSEGNVTRTEVRDSAGNLLQAASATYDLYGRAESATLGLTDTYAFDFDAEGKLVAGTDPLGIATQYAYDELKRLTQITLDAGGSAELVSLGYDVNDELTAVTAPGNVATGYAFNDLGDLLSETSPDRGALSYSHDAAGQVISVTDARGVIATLSYDAAGRATAIDYPGTAEDVALIYDNDPGCTLGVGRICRVEDAAGATRYDYDGFGNVTQVERVVDGVTYTTRYGYDDVNRLVSVTLPSGRLVSYSKDANGRTTSIGAVVDGVASDIAASIGYRGDDTIASIAYGNGIAQTHAYDPQTGRLSGVDVGTVGTLDYTYDANGRITTLTRDGADYRFAYDAHGRVEAEGIYTEAVPYTVAVAGNAPTGYWRLGEAPGVNTAADETGSFPGTYVSNPTRGKPSLIPNDLTNTAVQFNSYMYVEVPHDGALDNTGGGFSVEAWIKPSSRDLSNGRVPIATKTDNYLSNGWALMLWSYGRPYFDVGPASVIAPFQLTAGQTYHIVGVHEPDNTLRLYVDGVEVATASGAPSTVANNLKIAGHQPNWYVLFGTLDEVAVYSSALSAADVQAHYLSGAGPAGAWTTEYAYDASGNRTETIGTGGATYGYWQNSNRLADIDLAPVSMDAAGNITDDGTYEYLWSNAGRLAEVSEGAQSVAQYTYDSAGLRIKKVAGGSTTIYHYDVLGRLLSETDAAGNPIRDYVWRGLTPLAQIDRVGTDDVVTYLHTDHAGAPRYATDEVGNLVWRWHSDAFGQALPEQDVDGNGSATVVNLRFDGQYYDAETGLHYNWARYYDPATGRYISPDAAGLAGGLNAYAYVNGDPVNWVDPNGFRGVRAGTRANRARSEGITAGEVEALKILLSFNPISDIGVQAAEISADPSLPTIALAVVGVVDPSPANAIKRGCKKLFGPRVPKGLIGKTGRDIFGEVRLRGLTQNRPLADLTDTDIHKTFSDSPFILDDHAVSRMLDPRTRALGAQTPRDIARLLNNGTIANAGGGDIAIQYGSLEAIVNPVTNVVDTIRPYRPR